MKKQFLLVQFWSSFEALRLKPLDPSHIMSINSRLVHDLGIAGDDFDEFIKIFGTEKLDDDQISELQIFIPSETSHDSYLLAMARSWLAKKFPRLRLLFVQRIKSPHFTVEDFLEIVGTGAHRFT